MTQEKGASGRRVSNRSFTGRQGKKACEHLKEQFEV
jgi:homoaconitase/3-isopropylmalate dehydratase large subunit